ncbi:hypothetical protein O4H61_06260 [Roseovarius aestuarii]|nr:hypothetical protein [Roseovarius aestuarii]
MILIPFIPPRYSSARLGLATLTCALLMVALPADADAPVIQGIRVEKEGMGWRFHVTVQHADTGWDHYADGWEILDASGTVLATRTLHHPHVNEQPFTRSLGPIMLPDGTREVFVRAHCSLGAEPNEPTRVDIGF